MMLKTAQVFSIYIADSLSKSLKMQVNWVIYFFIFAVHMRHILKVGK